MDELERELQLELERTKDTRTPSHSSCDYSKQTRPQQSNKPPHNQETFRIDEQTIKTTLPTSCVRSKGKWRTQRANI